MSWWKTKQMNTFRVGACTDVGMVREENQDAFGQFRQNGSSGTDEQLFILADGMGGHVDGREASHLAVEEVHRAFFKSSDGPVGQRLAKALEAANERIIKRSHERDGVERMGTTCTALVIRQNEGYIAHVGDSRAYRINRNEMHQLTRDHTMVEEMRRQGVLTDSEARTHPRRHALTRALGIEPQLEVDLLDPLRVQAGEWYLMCSDGLSRVEESEIQQVVTSQDPQLACEQLVQMANDRGGHDNVTVLVVQVQ
jgi:protein phosphatase